MDHYEGCQQIESDKYLCEHKSFNLRKKMRIPSLSIFLCATVFFVHCLIFSSANAASFDCQKASTLVEKTICNSADLSQLDTQLAESYRIVAADQKTRQREWLRERNQCGADSNCLKAKYKERIVELKDMARRSAPIVNASRNESQLPIAEKVKSGFLLELLKRPPLKNSELYVRDKYVRFEVAPCTNLAPSINSQIDGVFTIVNEEKKNVPQSPLARETCQLRVVTHINRGSLVQLQFFSSENDRIQFNNRNIYDLFAPSVPIASITISSKGGFDVMMVEPEAGDKRFRRRCFSSKGTFEKVDWKQFCGYEGNWLK